MKAEILVIAGIIAMGMLSSCNKDLIMYEQGDIKIFVEKGDAWLHDFPLFLGIENGARTTTLWRKITWI